MRWLDRTRSSCRDLHTTCTQPERARLRLGIALSGEAEPLPVQIYGTDGYKSGELKTIQFGLGINQILL